MRILHCIGTMLGGGAERQLACLAAEMAERGHDVHVAFIRPGANSDRLEGSRCTLHPLRAWSKYDVSILPRLVLLARRLRPDVIQTWLTHMDIVGGVTAMLLRRPWIMTERSARLSYPPALLNRFRVLAGRRATLIVPNSPGGAEYWEEQGIDRSRIEIVLNFISHREIESAEPIDDPRIGADDELLLHVGRLSPEKNLHRLIAALDQVRRVRPRVKLVMCGDGPLRDALTTQLAGAQLSERVVFTGFVSNVASWLKRAAALVAVSLYEGHPNAVLEAMGAGVPVIVSDIPAFRSFLDEGSAAFVPVDDPAAIAAAIIDTLQNRAAAERRAEWSRGRVAALSIDATIARYEEVYRRAIALRLGQSTDSRNGASTISLNSR